MELFVTIILLAIKGAQGRELEGPENTLSVVGSNVTLKCLSPSSNCTGTEWSKYSAGNSVTVFNHHGKISSAHKERYTVDNFSSGCNLIIKNVQLTDAGRFICRALISSNTVEKSAFLIILETRPRCTTNVSSDETVEEDGVQLSCVVTYIGNDKVSMVWKGVNDAPSAVEYETLPKCRPTTIAPRKETVEGEGTYNETNRTGVTDACGVVRIRKTISLSYFVVASAPEVPSFTCITSFPVEAKDKDGKMINDLATNIPNTICETSTFRILYSVRNVSLSPSLSYYSSGSVITCTAKGRPLPTFKWQEMENNSTWMDIQNQKNREFTVNDARSKWYRCFAVNVVRGKSYNATSHEFLINNTGSDSNGRFTAITIMSVTVCFLLLIVLLIICFCVRACPGYNCCHSANKSKDGVAQRRQLSAMDPSIPRTEAPLVTEQETAYASLGGDRDANEYASIEQRQKTKPNKKSSP